MSRSSTKTLDSGYDNVYCFDVNSFTAKFKNVVWDYFHVQQYTSFQEANNIIGQNYLLAYNNELNITEKSELHVPAQTPPFEGGV